MPGTKRQEEGEAGRQRVRPGPHGHQARIPAWALVHVAVMGLGLPLSARGLTGDLVPPPLGREAPGLVAQWPSWDRPHETAQWSWPRTGRIDVALVAALDNLLPCLRTIRSEATNGEDQIIAGDNVL